MDNMTLQFATPANGGALDLMKRIAKSLLFIGICIGMALALVAGLTLFAWAHRNDHALLHALEQRELARMRAAQQQQQAAPIIRPTPDVTTPVSPPVASSPVPERK